MIIILTHIPCYISVNQVETVREHIKWKVFGDTVQNLGAQKKRNAPTKKNFFGHTGCPAKLFPLSYLLLCRLLLMQIAKVGSFMKNSGNLLQDWHKNFEN